MTTATAQLRQQPHRWPELDVSDQVVPGQRRHLVLKGLLDRGLSLVLIVLLLPLLVVLAVLVRVTSPGPALFRQTRVGRNGELFSLLKFRSMQVDAERLVAELRPHSEGNVVLFKLRRDPRVTPIGRALRRYSLDELPQLLNVLRGQMSLVGPRPPLPTEVELYEGTTHRRLLVKPGLTGLWQVSGRSNLSWEQSIALDLYYVEHWSIALDLRLLLRTLSAVIRGEGAY